MQKYVYFHQSFEENHLLELSLEEGIARGKVMLHSFKVLYDRYLATKDALIKSQGFSIHHAKANLRDHGTIQTKEGEEEGGDEGDREGDREDQEDQEGRLLPEIADGFSIEDVHHILERRQDTTMLFVVAEYSYLEPGFSYIFRTRGQNVAGFGPWSVPTFSTFTHPTAPSVPHRPHIAEATLRSILFQWEPPETGGSAITGYDIILKNNNRHISLPRSAVTYLWEGLFPGRSYYIKVQARNEVGESGYSEWNLPTQSHTLTGPPEVPPNPRAVAGSWDRITLQTRLSYNNGAVITSMQIEQRFIDPFQIGDWSNPWNHSTRKIPGEVEIVEAVDFEQQQREIEEMVEQLELLKASSGFNPYGNDGHKIDKQIQSMLEKQVRFLYYKSSLPWSSVRSADKSK